MSINADIAGDGASIVVAPEYGDPITIEVEFKETCISGPRAWRKAYGKRYVVHLKGSGDKFAHFTTLELGVRSALVRARRYEKAYSKPRQVAA